MPTFEVTDQFWSDMAKLSHENRRLFMRCRDFLVEDLRAGTTPRPSLRVKRYRSQQDVWELTWAGDGRALFMYGSERLPGQPHVVWLRIGSHEIFR